jgi:hypothetical protein
MVKKLPKIIPPRSEVILIHADKRTPEWKHIIGKRFRIGYYGKKDGLDVIWLVDDNGDYSETTSREFLLKYFQIVKISKVKDYFGIRSPIIKPRAK